MTQRVPRKSQEDLIVEARIRSHLRQQMDERGIKAVELSRRIGSDQGNLSRILAGERGIGLGLVLRIAQALKISPTRLMEEWAEGEQYRDKEPQPPPPRIHTKKR